MDQSLLNDIITKAQEYAMANDEKQLRKMLQCFDKRYYQPDTDTAIPDVIYDQVVEIYDNKFLLIYLYIHLYY